MALKGCYLKLPAELGPTPYSLGSTQMPYDHTATERNLDERMCNETYVQALASAMQWLLSQKTTECKAQGKSDDRS